MGKHKEYWVVIIESDSEREIVQVMHDKVYACGDEQGWPLTVVKTWVRKIRL